MTIEELKEFQKNLLKNRKKFKYIYLTIVEIIILIYLILFFKNIKINNNNSFLIITFFQGIIFIAIFSFVIYMIISAIAFGNKNNVIKQEYKKLFVFNSLKKIFDNFEYAPNKGLSEEFIESTGMIYTGDDYSSEDYIKGTYKGLDFEQSDVLITEERETTDSDGDTHTETVTLFNGRFMVFDFNKEFRTSFIVSSGGMSIARGNKNYQLVKMEDEQFNKRFRIYAENEHEVFYVITPQLMEKLKYLSNKYKYGIILFFKNSKLIVGVHGEDSFEPDYNKEINEEEITQKITDEIRVITDLVDFLKLDNNLFKK